MSTSTDRTTLRRVRRVDRWARRVITLGGIVVILAVVAILVLIVAMTLPLFTPPSARVYASVPLPGQASAADLLAVGADINLGQHGSLSAHTLARDGTFMFLDVVPSGEVKVIDRQRIDPPAKAAGVKLVSAQCFRGAMYSLLWSDGSMSLVEVTSTVQFDEHDRRSVKYVAKERAASPAGKGEMPVLAVLGRTEGGSTARAAVLPDGSVTIDRFLKETNLLGQEIVKQRQEVLLPAGGPKVTAMAVGGSAEAVYVGRADGTLAGWRFDDSGDCKDKFEAKLPGGAAVSAMSLLIGDISLAVGDQSGGLGVWFPVREEGGTQLKLIHPLRSHGAEVRQILASGRNRTLASVDSRGTIDFDFSTNERHLLSIRAADGVPPAQTGLSARGDLLATVDAQGRLTVRQITNPYPEINLKSLFGYVHYENYPAPQFAWQTTGGDEFEAKFSLMPLVFGTLKGTFYAMLLAVPLALFGAAYTSQFTTPAFRRVIKPSVELMAAVPSVVIGFLIALWLAPILEKWVLAVFMSLITVPLAFVAFMLLWQFLRRFDWAKRVENGYEFAALVPAILLGIWLAMAMAGPLESAFFGGSFKQWLTNTLAFHFDQRNCVVIAFGLGFAVIPIVFSIAEDSLSTVPHTLTAASLALGASRWQTLWRVILPSGSPGIFAGIMIGFGRAVGETMIVLMATGNTPILEMSPFTGMRTLSANIAVEIPGAPVGGTLYRVLFLCAVLLFAMTFLLNTAAELVRQHLRKRYGRF